MKNFSAGSREGCWPTPEQTLLLRACLFQGAPALDAWKRWRQRVNFDSVDGASYRLLPLVYRNLKDELAEPIASRLKGIYRHTWSRNQLLFHAVADMLRALDEAGIRSVLLKGAALAVNHYADAGLRPMADFDFMIAQENAPRAFEILQRHGWRHIEPVLLHQIIWCSHAAKFRNGREQELDIHWHMLPEGRQPGADDDIWRGAKKINFCGVDVLCANPTDLLLHVCAHGAIGDPVPPIRWIADAWMILSRPPGTVDWGRLVTLARKRALTLSVGRALEFLQAGFSAPVPPSVIATMRNTRHAWPERWEYRIKSGPRGLLGALPLHCANYIRLAAHDSFWKKITGVPFFFRRTWGISDAWGLPVYVLKKTINRLPKKNRV
jgi:Uncharacterised nucleotidyltransferase